MSKKILLGFLVVTLIAPTVFFVRPQKAEALVSLAACIASKVTALATAAGPIIGNAILSVGTSDKVTETAASIGPASNDWVVCFLKSLAKIIAKTLLHTFTQSLVNWINTGFQGSPSFVTNPEGFLNNVADQAIGRIIQDISPLLCSPFRLDVRFALGLDLSFRNREEIRCRLSDVIANVSGAYNGFVNGAVGSGNLSSWIHIAGTPQNNPYGAYIATTNKFSVGITSATGQQIKLLDWGQGFKSWRNCVEYAPDILTRGTTPGGAYGIIGTRKGACIKESAIKTPGSVLVAQANKALGGTLDELQLANEIDEVVGALINQLLLKAITGIGGLLGTSQGDSSNGGMSSVQALLTDTNAAIAGSNAKPPDGINCSLRYYPTTIEAPTGSGIYIPDPNPTANQVWTDNLGVGQTVGVLLDDTRLFVPAQYVKGGIITPVVKEAGQTWATYFAEVRAGCKNNFSQLITNASTEGLSIASVGAGGGTTAPPNTTPTKIPAQQEIPLAGVVLNQSHSFFEGQPTNAYRGPERALFGYGYSDTSGKDVDGHPAEGSGAPQWWTASLRQPEKIKIITIRTFPGYPLESVILAKIPPKAGPLTLGDVTGGFSYSGDLNAAIPNATISGTNEDLTITFTKAIEANAIAISCDIKCTDEGFGHALRLTSVKLYPPVETADANTPPPAFAFSVTPTVPPEFDIPNKDAAFLWSGLSFSPNLPKTGIRLRAKFYTCLGSPCVFNPAPEAFTNYFNSLHFNYWVNGNQTTITAIPRPPQGTNPTYNSDPETGVTVVDIPASVIFADKLSVQKDVPITINVDGVLGTRMPFRIVIEAEDNVTDALLGSTTANFIK